VTRSCACRLLGPALEIAHQRRLSAQTTPAAAAASAAARSLEGGWSNPAAGHAHIPDHRDAPRSEARKDRALARAYAPGKCRPRLVAAVSVSADEELADLDGISPRRMANSRRLPPLEPLVAGRLAEALTAELAERLDQVRCVKGACYMRLFCSVIPFVDLT